MSQDPRIPVLPEEAYSYFEKTVPTHVANYIQDVFEKDCINFVLILGLLTGDDPRALVRFASDDPRRNHPRYKDTLPGVRTVGILFVWHTKQFFLCDPEIAKFKAYPLPETMSLEYIRHWLLVEHELPTRTLQSLRQEPYYPRLVQSFKSYGPSTTYRLPQHRLPQHRRQISQTMHRLYRQIIMKKQLIHMQSEELCDILRGVLEYLTYEDSDWNFEGMHPGRVLNRLVKHDLKTISTCFRDSVPSDDDSKRDIFRRFIGHLLFKKGANLGKMIEDYLKTVVGTLKKTQGSIVQYYKTDAEFEHVNATIKFWETVVDKKYTKKCSQHLANIKRQKQHRDKMRKRTMTDYQRAVSRQKGESPDFKKQLARFLQEEKEKTLGEILRISNYGRTSDATYRLYYHATQGNYRLRPPDQHPSHGQDVVLQQDRMFHLIYNVLQMYDQFETIIGELPPDIDQETFDDYYEFLRESIMDINANLTLSLQSQASQDGENGENDVQGAQTQDRASQQGPPQQPTRTMRFQDMFPFTGHRPVFYKSKKITRVDEFGNDVQLQVPCDEHQLRAYNDQLRSRKQHNARILKYEFKERLDEIYGIIERKHRQGFTIVIVDVNNWGFGHGRLDFQDRNIIDPTALMAEIRSDDTYRSKLRGKLFWVFVGQKDMKGIDILNVSDNFIIIQAGCVYTDPYNGQDKDCFTGALTMNPVDDMIIKNLLEYVKELQTTDKSRKGAVYVGRDLFRDLKKSHDIY